MKYIQEKREYYKAKDFVIIRAKRNPYNLPDSRKRTKSMCCLFKQKRSWKHYRKYQYK